MKRKLLDRRRFIQAAGGMTLALPLMSSLRARGTPAAFPKRLVTMYTPNGQITDRWHPKSVTSETDFVLSDTHQPLATHKDRMTLFRGIDLVIADVPSGGPGGPHQRSSCRGSLHSCQTRSGAASNSASIVIVSNLASLRTAVTVIGLSPSLIRV